MQKKPYTPPAITEHGAVVKKTTGLGGDYIEAYCPRSTSPFPSEDEPKQD